MSLPDPDPALPIREMPCGHGLPEFSPLYYGIRYSRCSWCGGVFALIDDVQICLECDRTVR